MSEYIEIEGTVLEGVDYFVKQSLTSVVVLYPSRLGEAYQKGKLTMLQP